MKKSKILSLLLSLTMLFALTISGATAYADNATDNGMKISKTAVANDDGSYTISLEAYATGSKVISDIKKDVPTDIVLVLDQSGSMAYCMVCGQEIGKNSMHNAYTTVDSVNTSNRYYIKDGSKYTEVSYCSGKHGFGYSCDGGAGWYIGRWSSDHTTANRITPKTSDNPGGTQFYSYKREACSSRLTALKTAVTSFANAVNEKAKGKDKQYGTADDINHRIAVVGFASQSGYDNNTELLSISGRNSGSVGVAYNDIKNQNLKDVMQSMDTNAGMTMVTNAINALAAEGATRTDLGMDMAKRILEQNPVTAGEKRNRVVIVFTDGSPTSQNGFEKSVANAAIKTSDEIKSGDTTVYSVGIFSGADATSAGMEPNGDLDQNSNQLSAASNWFMQKLSSNNGTPQSPSYYLSAADADSLNSIFQQISDQIETGGSSSTLTSEAVVKDIISPQFTLPKDATASDIMLETYACTGKNGSDYTWSKNNDAMGAKATIDSANNQVNVTGFDFSENYVGTVTENGNVSYRGHKLVIKFKVEAREGFLGGNDVYTNTSAGVYENGKAETPVLTFERPTVNVPIKTVTVTAEDKNVYLKGEVTADQLKEGATVKVGDVELDLSKADDNYGLAAWQNEYVDITVEMKDKAGNAIPADGLKDLTDDTTYTIEVKVAPKTVGTTTTEKGPAATEKKDVNNPAAKINVFKPNLTFKDSGAYYGEQVPEEFSSNKVGEKWMHGDTVSTGTGVTMLGDKPELTISYTPDESKIKDGKYTKQDVPVKATVKIGTVDVNDHTIFKHQNCTGKTCTVPEDNHFLVHIKTCALTVTKAGGASNESYVFDVYKDNVKYSEVTVWGNGTETLVELPIGTYTIQENTGWSWRYPNPTYTGAVTLSTDTPNGSITCTNKQEKNKWLNGFSEVVRNILN